MKSFTVLHLAALSTAFVVPNQDVLRDVQIETRSARDRASKHMTLTERLFEDFEQTIDDFANSGASNLESAGRNAHQFIDDALSRATEASDRASKQSKGLYSDVKDELSIAQDDILQGLHDIADDPHRPHDPDKPGHPPHHPGHGHREPNMTVYQLISEYKYSKKLAAAIDKFPELVDALNSTKANYTVFAPVDSAFEKLHHEPSEDELRTILTYHVSPEFYPASRVLVTRTIPTLLKSDDLGVHGNPQRLSTQIGLRGLTVNFVTRIIAFNVFGTNGVIHGVDSIILPPPKLLEVIDFLPTGFSTLELGLLKTGLLEEFNNTARHGGTFFAPNNFAFQKLGPRINGFLFSQYGQKYLKALLKYHIVANQTLYSDAYYKDDSSDADADDGPPKGLFHVDLPTLLEDKSLSIDIGRYGRLIEIKINAFARVNIPDGIAEDGVLHDLGDVLIPPKRLANAKLDVWTGKDQLTVEELVERLNEHAESDLHVVADQIEFEPLEL